MAQSDDTGNGKNGVLVVPSSNLTAEPDFVATGQVSPIAATFQVTLGSSGAVSSYSVKDIAYALEGSDGNAQLYGLNLADTGSAPAPVQISSLSVPVASLCHFDYAQTDSSDPTSLFILLDVAGSNGCGSSSVGDLFEVVHYTDPATTAPTQVAVSTTSFDLVYGTDGKLAGLVLLDPVSSNLYFYAGGDLTSTPTTLLANVKAVSSLYSASALAQGTVTGAVFEAVTTSAGQSVYRIDTSGNATQVYTAQGTLGSGVADDSNLYFTDTTSSTEMLMQEALSGGAPMQLYSAATSSTSADTLVGSNGSVLVFVTNSGTGASSTLNTLPVGKTSSSPTPIGSFTGSASAFLIGPPGNLAQSVLLVDIIATSGATTSFSSTALSPDGTVLQQLEAGSQWSTTSLSGSALLVKGITDTGATDGGGSIYVYDIATNTLSSQALGSSGSPYVIPTGDVPGLVYLSGTVGYGDIAEPALGVSLGVAFDQSQGILVPISLQDTLIKPF